MFAGCPLPPLTADSVWELTVPEALTAQLADGARLVMPVGPHGAQRLVSIERRGETLERTDLDLVSFVPMLEGVV